MALIVNGERIEEERVRYEVERMRPEFEQAFGDDEPEQREARLLEWARENIVEQVLLRQEAEADEEPMPPDELRQAVEEAQQRLGLEEADDDFEREVAVRLRIQRIFDRLAEGVADPTDEEVEGLYEENRDEFMAPEQVHVAHIVKHWGEGASPDDARAELEAARAELEQGADFAEVAAGHSDCPDDGGDLGWFPRGQMVDEFEHVVFAMGVGKVSQVFATRFGLHLVKVLDRRPAAPVPLDEVRDQIREHLLREARNKAVEKYLDGLRMRATVTEG